MKNVRSSISKAGEYSEIGEFWDTHDLTDYWEKTLPARFAVTLESEATYFGVEKTLSRKLAKIAKRRGVSAHTLVNLWLQEKLSETKTA